MSITPRTVQMRIFCHREVMMRSKKMPTVYYEAGVSTLLVESRRPSDIMSRRILNTPLPEQPR